MSRRPERRRKIPNYFGDVQSPHLDWSSQGWAVKFWCDQLHRWDWETLQTSRVGPKLKAEAKAAALNLMKASVEREVAVLETLTRKIERRKLEIAGIESGKMDWSVL